MKNTYFMVLILMFLSSFTFAQEEEKEPKHIITAALGYTFIPSGAPSGSHEEEGAFVPSIGLDYFYRLGSKWEIGIMSDLELGEYVLIQKELNRENAFLLAAVASYSLTKSLNVFAGGGMEFEKHHNLGVIRLGTEYAFKLKKGWVLAPGLLFDFKEGTDTWSLSIAFGKEF